MSDLERQLESVTAAASNLAWGPHLVFWLVGGGLFLLLFSGLVPLRRFPHALGLLIKSKSDKDAPGEITPRQALTTALAATVGMGNVGGVAVAITQGGPGAVFWMWLTAIVGMATKFYSGSLAVMFRGKDSLGQVQGGPMYAIETGLGPKFKPMALAFSFFGLVGCLPMFSANQVSEILNSSYQVPPVWTATICTVLVGFVAFSGVTRIGALTERLVPLMCGAYLFLAFLVLAIHASELPGVFASIFTEAFSGSAATGAAQGVALRHVILTGVKRAAFSNEAGLGTAPMAHGAAKTSNPIREGLVAMLGPFVDTILVCTVTALLILVATDWQSSEIAGVALTSSAVSTTLGAFGELAMVVIVLLFGLTTMVSYSYYGKKCFSYLFGAGKDWIYSWIYLAGLFVGGVVSAAIAVNVIDTAFALMAIPNMAVTVLLARHVNREAKQYFSDLRQASSSRS